MGYEIRPLPELRYEVSQNLLVDYAHVLTETLPELLAERDLLRAVVAHDSVLMANHRETIAMYERQEVELDRVVDLYEAEIEKRRRIETIWRHEARRLKWWRRGMAAAAIGGITIAVLK